MMHMGKQKLYIRFGILQLVTLLLFISGALYYTIMHWPSNEDTKQSTITVKTTPVDTNARYLVIPEWNIKILLSKPIEDAYYDAKTDSELESRSLRSASLADEEGCAKDPQSIATIFKVNNDAVDEQLNKKYRDTQDGVTIGSSFYFIQTSQFSCTPKPEKAELLQSIRSAFGDASKTIQAR
jgi:hypothetical protein